MNKNLLYFQQNGSNKSLSILLSVVFELFAKKYVKTFNILHEKFNWSSNFTHQAHYFF